MGNPDLSLDILVVECARGLRSKNEQRIMLFVLGIYPYIWASSNHHDSQENPVLPRHPDTF